MPKITVARRKAISGEWESGYHQDQNENRKSKDLPIKFFLDASPRLIKGTMTIEDGEVYKFYIEGPFYHDRYLRLNYTASNETEFAIDFGSIFLVLDDFPDKMKGKVCGYGSMSKTLISGGISLKKNA